MNLYFTCSQLSFEVYISCLARNLKFWPFLVWKISFLTFVIWQLVAAKVHNWRGCFWCLWKAKDQNIYLRTSFGQKVACLVNLWSLKYGRDDLTSPQVSTSFQSPGGIGLKVNIFNHRLESLNFILFPCSITHFDPDISTFDDFTLGVLRSWANQLSGWALSQLHIVSSHCNMVIMLTNRTKFIWLKQ